MNFVTFNQDYSYLAVGMHAPTHPPSNVTTTIHATAVLTQYLGTSKGFRIFTTDPFSKSHETKEGNIAILEMLFSTSLVALILSPRRLQITNTKVSAQKPRSMVLVMRRLVLIINPATIYHLRVDLSHYRISGEVEPETTCDST